MINQTKQTAEAWLPIALQEIRARMQKLKVNDTGELLRSVKGTISEVAGGDSYKAEILYNYYGIFPDMGVGRGQSMGDAAANKLAGGSRKRKPWSKAIAHQGHRFAELMGGSYARMTVEEVVKELPKVVGFDF